MTEQLERPAYEIREVYLTDRLAAAQNVAANGRLFCVLLCAINLIEHNSLLAIVSIIPIGASCIIDPLPNGRLRLIASQAIYALGAFALIITMCSI